MKNLFLSIMLLASYSYASTGTLNPKKIAIMYPSHTCTYRMYNSSGDYLGLYSVYNVPNDMECGLPAVKNTAINGWNDSH